MHIWNSKGELSVKFYIPAYLRFREPLVVLLDMNLSSIKKLSLLKTSSSSRGQRPLKNEDNKKVQQSPRIIFWRRGTYEEMKKVKIVKEDNIYDSDTYVYMSLITTANLDLSEDQSPVPISE